MFSVESICLFSLARHKIEHSHRWQNSPVWYDSVAKINLLEPILTISYSL